MTMEGTPAETSNSGIENNGRPPSAAAQIAPPSGLRDRPETENIDHEDASSPDDPTDAPPSKCNTRLVKFQLFETKTVRRLSLST